MLNYLEALVTDELVDLLTLLFEKCFYVDLPALEDSIGLEPSQVIGNQMQIVAALAPNQHNSFLVTLLGECPGLFSSAAFDSTGIHHHEQLLGGLRSPRGLSVGTVSILLEHVLPYFYSLDVVRVESVPVLQKHFLQLVVVCHALVDRVVRQLGLVGVRLDQLFFMACFSLVLLTRFIFVT